MARWFQLEAADESVFTTAAHRYDYRIDAAVSAQVLWDSLASDESLSAWGSSVKSLEWFTPRPFGVGTRRSVTLAGAAATVHEQFIVWDEGSRYAFYVFEANRPGLRRLAEDYRVSTTETGSRLDWTVVIDPTPATRIPLRIANPVTRAAFGRMAAEGATYFAKLASS